MRRRLLVLLLLCTALKVAAQEFVNLTAQQVRIDSVLPVCFHEFPLGTNYGDSTYTVSIEYPEFIDMEQADIDRYHAITTDTLPSLPVVEQQVGVSRKRGTLYVSLVPLAFRDGRYQKLVSYKLKVQAVQKDPPPTPPYMEGRDYRENNNPDLQGNYSPPFREGSGVGRYASHSVLATGRWAKISVPETGIYQITDRLVRQAGFTDISKVKVYGYGGALQPEVLTADYLAQTDDLSEVPLCVVGGKRLFHATGTVGWESATTDTRTRNPYSDAACYFLTESDTEPLTLDSAAFMASFYPTANDYHSLHEIDDYAWYHSGRNLYESTPVKSDTWSTYELAAHDGSGRLTVVLTSNTAATVSVAVNDSVVGTVNCAGAFTDQDRGGAVTKTFTLQGMLKERNTIGLRQTAGQGTVRLDYLSLTMPTPAQAPDLVGGTFSQPTLLYRITNQDHHADSTADMVIIVPTTQKVMAQAQRLKELHERHDSLRINIVPADELYNEFSSGTPDANAYRRYLKMLYDRATTEADAPRYLLLFGDGAWDNRMLSSNWRQTSPDDFLLCYESENSFSATESYVSDDYFCLLDDGEGADLLRTDKTDVGVGRLTALTEEEAKVLVDKIEDYLNNAHAGDWQNTLCFMADDGNGNVHMQEAEAAVKQVTASHTAYNVKKIYWDAYQRTTSSTGYRYPDVEQLIRKQMRAGALIMDYCGHGAAYCLSHEQVVRTEDFAAQTSLRLPLWVTASCDIMPFDSHEENIGETAMANAKGGAIAFFGTTRTVYTGDNQNMNCAFLRHVMSTETDGHRRTLGDAVRLSKNELRYMSYESKRINKLHYSLLGDPALRLAAPQMHIVVDSINGQPVANGTITLAAGKAVSVAGHVEGGDSFDGTVSLTVSDVQQTVTCRLNETGQEGASTPFTFTDRPVTLYNGQDSVRRGRFSQTFVLPQDISYSDATGRMTVYALSSDRRHEANGSCEAFTMGSDSKTVTDGIGPSIYCYLNTADFQNGGAVNTTPYFYAQLTDKDGINAAGSGVGHDLELTVDGDPSMTFNLNAAFSYDFGDYRSGSVGYSLPELAEGDHRLTFRAWDVLNNSSVAELKFRVVRGLQPHCFSVECTRNPATTATSFIITHDRTGSQMDVVLEVLDASGRLLWRKSESGVSTNNTYTLDWDLTTSSGSRLQTGVYLYRVLISSDGSGHASQAKKLIILRNH